MKYRVILPKRVQKEYQKIDKKLRDRINKMLLALSENPSIGKKLEGKYKGQYSIRVWPYRVIYEIYQKEAIILITHVGHRQGVYKN